jgi:outer membrane protein assembly factor BamD (BamD/ComL family)
MHVYSINYRFFIFLYIFFIQRFLRRYCTKLNTNLVLYIYIYIYIYRERERERERESTKLGFSFVQYAYSTKLGLEFY